MGGASKQKSRDIIVQEKIDEAVSEAVADERKRIRQCICNYEFSADAYTFDVVVSVLRDIRDMVGE